MARKSQIQLRLPQRTPTVHPIQFSISFLSKVVLMDCLHNFNKAKRSWKEKNYSKARKNLVHGLRWLEFAEQMARNDGKIVDLYAANKWWFEVIFLSYQK
jgi:hypothetical protein